ncbi:hypothetical protein CTZ27_16265 [Streptomyces griseocarneus]|nr:hypothetical protein CTZ27_16265 [Streptomyces griseocarneus]
MAFEDEWATLRGDAVRTQLNGVPGGLGRPGGDAELKSSAAQKKAAINALEQHILPDLKKAGSSMDDAAGDATKGFKDWATGAGKRQR